MNTRIKKIRKESNLSMEEFAKRVGITRSSISRIESGENNPSEQTIILICKEFGVNKEWLLTGEGEIHRDADIDFGRMCKDIGINDPKAREAIVKYYALPPKDKELWWNFVEKFMK